MQTNNLMQAKNIINFWFSEPMNQHWFSSTAEIDQDIRDRYEAIWEQANAGELDNWQNSAEGALALVIILDQFPLNMFRGEAKSFASESKAIEIAKQAIGQGFNKQLPIGQLSFLFMPLMHSENLEDQALSVAMYRQHNLKNNIRFAEHHHNIIKTYGRFPHRNAILGRQSTQAEEAYLASKDAFKG